MSIIWFSKTNENKEDIRNNINNGNNPSNENNENNTIKQESLSNVTQSVIHTTK